MTNGTEFPPQSVDPAKEEEDNKAESSDTMHWHEGRDKNYTTEESTAAFNKTLDEAYNDSHLNLNDGKFGFTDRNELEGIEGISDVEEIEDRNSTYSKLHKEKEAISDEIKNKNELKSLKSAQDKIRNEIAMESGRTINDNRKQFRQFTIPMDEDSAPSNPPILEDMRKEDVRLNLKIEEAEIKLSGKESSTEDLEAKLQTTIQELNNIKAECPAEIKNIKIMYAAELGLEENADKSKVLERRKELEDELKKYFDYGIFQKKCEALAEARAGKIDNDYKDEMEKSMLAGIKGRLEDVDELFRGRKLDDGSMSEEEQKALDEYLKTFGEMMRLKSQIKKCEYLLKDEDKLLSEIQVGDTKQLEHFKDLTEIESEETLSSFMISRGNADKDGYYIDPMQDAKEFYKKFKDSKAGKATGMVGSFFFGMLYYIMHKNPFDSIVEKWTGKKIPDWATGKSSAKK
jgi:hypothetical protein